MRKLCSFCFKIKGFTGERIVTNKCDFCTRGGKKKRKNYYVKKIRQPRESIPVEIQAPKELYVNVKSRAKKFNYEFTLTYDKFLYIIKQNCYYCDDKPACIKRHVRKTLKQIFTYQGIDRVDSNLGYSDDNVVPCCFICNTIKSNKTQREFYDWINKVYKNRLQEKYG